MNDLFALAPLAERPIDCRPGFSFFFDLIRQECNGLSRPMHRVCTLMRKMGVQSLVREELALNDELKCEQADVQLRTNGKISFKAVRLTFFRDSPELASWRELKDVLGYVVLVIMTLPDGNPSCYILESVISTPFIVIERNGAPSLESVTNYYIHCSREFSTIVGTSEDHISYRLLGTFFCQQNCLTHVCAHAALRMGINSSPTYGGPKLTNQKINELLRIDHTLNRRVGKYAPESDSIGLTTEQIVGVVGAMGWEAHVADFLFNPAIDYEDYIYPIMESGCPVIIGIHGPRTAHVLAVIGHTLNSDRWSPEARRGYGAFPISPYISTSAWTDHFIVSDDNFGMYVTLPVESMRNVLVPKYNPNLHASLAIGLVPRGVNTTGYAVEQLAALYVRKLVEGTCPTASNRWLQLLKEPGPGNVPWIVENAVGGLAAEQTGSAVKIANQTTQPHEERES